MAGHVEVLWVSEELESTERCIVRDEPGERCIEGTTELPFMKEHASISYVVATNSDWSTRLVDVELDAGEQIQTLRLERGRGGWTVNGVHRPDLAGCTNVDLGWTPATNTLAIRHALLQLNETKTADAAWVRFPEFDVVCSEQTYSRRSIDLVRYQSNTFEADVQVTADDVVTLYGDGLWRASSVVHSVTR